MPAFVVNRDKVAWRVVDDEAVIMDRHLTPAQLAALYRACRVAVFPYRAEGFVIPALEALACGVPTIVPRFGAALDFSDDETSFLVPATRIALPVRRTFRLQLGFEVELEAVDFCEIPVPALAAALRRAREAGPETLGAKGAAGARIARERFTWSHASERVERCLRELTAGT